MKKVDTGFQIQSDPMVRGLNPVLQTASVYDKAGRWLTGHFKIQYRLEEVQCGLWLVASVAPKTYELN